MAQREGEMPAEPTVSPGAGDLHEDPAQLLTVRRAELADVRRRLTELKLRQTRIELFRARIGTAVRVLVFALLLFLLILLALLAIQAARSERLVVRPFDVPEAVEQRGATGETLAQLVADELSRLRSSAAPGSHPGGAFETRQIVVEPMAPRSWLAGLHASLADLLGDDTHVSGSLMRTDDGMFRLTVRGDGVPARSFSGRSRELPSLGVLAAGHIFGSAAPAAYLQQLVEAGRADEAASFASAAFEEAKGPRERSEIARLWAEALAASGDYPQAQEQARRALSLDPSNWPAYATLAGAVPDEQAALQATRLLRARIAEAGRRQPVDPRLFANEQRLTQDWASLAELPGAAGRAGAEPIVAARAVAEAYRHDYRAARRHLLTLSAEDPLSRAATDLITGLRELDLGRADRAIPPLERFEKALGGSDRLRHLFRGDRCHLALAYARVGRNRDALRLLRDADHSSRCNALRGDVLALSGDWSAAAKAYRTAIADAPSLPLPRERAASALLARDQADAAAELFRAAIAHGPRWADPRFGLAEALMRLGRFAEAEAEYRAAAPLAPRWGALHIGWGEALWRAGRQQEARQVWRTVAGMELSAANRVRLQQLLSIAG